MADDIFNTDTFLKDFCTGYPQLQNCHIECFEEIDSTNTHAKRLLAQAGTLRGDDDSLTKNGTFFHKSIFVSESQTQGRGRLGRTFVSPARTGIYITVVYVPQGGIIDPARFTVSAAVAVCRSIRKLFGNVEPKIKWINDIFVNARKICGILTEGAVNPLNGKVESAVIGIGINIRDNPLFAGDLGTVAGSITQSDDCPTRSLLAATVCGELLTILDSDADIINEYKKDSFILGQTVEVHPVIGDDKTVYSAKAMDIDENANLIVQLADGTTKVLGSGEVSLKSYNFV